MCVHWCKFLWAGRNFLPTMLICFSFCYDMILVSNVEILSKNCYAPVFLFSLGFNLGWQHYSPSLPPQKLLLKYDTKNMSFYFSAESQAVLLLFHLMSHTLRLFQSLEKSLLTPFNSLKHLLFICFKSINTLCLALNFLGLCLGITLAGLT